MTLGLNKDIPYHESHTLSDNRKSSKKIYDSCKMGSQPGDHPKVPCAAMILHCLTRLDQRSVKWAVNLVITLGSHNAAVILHCLTRPDQRSFLGHQQPSARVYLPTVVQDDVLYLWSGLLDLGWWLICQQRGEPSCPVYRLLLGLEYWNRSKKM